MSRKLFSQQRQQSTTTSTATAKAATSVWLLFLIFFFFTCTAFYPLSTQASPLHSTTTTTRTKRHTLTSTPTHIHQHHTTKAHRDHYRGGATSSSSAYYSSDCAHDSIAELIKTSPVILKALGAHIFTDDDFNGMGTPFALMMMAASAAGVQQQQQQLNNFRNQQRRRQTAATSTSSATNNNTNNDDHMQSSNKENSNNVRGMFGTNTITSTLPETESILITLTPETIYKGASLLKMSPGSRNGARSSSFANANAAESATLYDGQLNATLQPLHCFDGSLLQLLPTELIVFGKLITTTQQQQQMFEPQTPQEQQFQQQQQQEQLQQQQQQQLPHLASATTSNKQNVEDILHISINGFHRWTPQFENHIWKHLGWDDWSDFTLCSVTCGKGVQQRFRRCLLDNPMVNLNINANSNAIVEVNAEDESDDDIDDNEVNDDGHGDDAFTDDDGVNTNDNNNNNETDDDAEAAAAFADVVNENMEITNEHEKQKSQRDNSSSSIDDELNSIQNIKRSNVMSDESTKAKATSTATITTSTSEGGAAPTASAATSKTKIEIPKAKRRDFQTMETNDATPITTKKKIIQKTTTIRTTTITEIPSPLVATIRPVGVVAADSDDELEHLQPVTLTSDGDNNEHIVQHVVENIVNILNDDDNGGHSNGNAMRYENMWKDQQQQVYNNKQQQKHKRIRKPHKRRKATKSFSTMFCEGYNIEQRNCNTFECSDDISDLLKFYKRPNVYEDVSVPLSPPTAFSGGTSTNDFKANILSSLITKTDVVTSASMAFVAPSLFDENSTNNASGATVLANSTPLTTPANMGYIRRWHNPLNFTIMLTLRVKNDSKNSATIFSIRNSTHNLYLDQCQDGLRLYLERDSSTEMLPIKFKLYDYRWHQVAISIQNGDFISIYVDCSWTNSFVVSKRLFTLPLDADAEIGRGFNGELQQLLLMPENQERHQCSNRRTSINEVKRYIIDTFIGDYGN